jgi:hypothetical protein
VENSKANKKLLSLNFWTVLALFILYIVTFTIGSFYSVALFKTEVSKAVDQSFEFSVATSLVGSSIFYLRKLYKACISDDYTFEHGPWQNHIGTFFYFALRPAFAAAFAAIAYLLLKWTVVTSVSGFNGLSYSHFILSGVEGFFVGFLAGKVLGRLKHVGEKHIEGFW